MGNGVRDLLEGATQPVRDVVIIMAAIAWFVTTTGIWQPAQRQVEQGVLRQVSDDAENDRYRMLSNQETLMDGQSAMASAIAKQAQQMLVMHEKITQLERALDRHDSRDQRRGG